MVNLKRIGGKDNSILPFIAIPSKITIQHVN